MDDFEDPVISPNARVDVFRDTQSLKLKISDLTVERLARVFKVIRHTRFLIYSELPLRPSVVESLFRVDLPTQL